MMEHTESASIMAILADGSLAIGTMWMTPARTGTSQVEYDGKWRSGGRSDYSDESEMRAAAKALLKEMAEPHRR
jgi:hypothetical protein